MLLIDGDREENMDASELLGIAVIKEYMSIVGVIGYIVSSVRFASKFAHLVLLRRLQHPRRWDMYMAVWCMEYLYATKDMPLVLGGSTKETEVKCDAALGVLDERRSIQCHVEYANSESGAIYMMSTAIKNTVTTIFKGVLVS